MSAQHNALQQCHYMYFAQTVTYDNILELCETPNEKLS